ncbi:hypothetical protein WR25_21248 [Diploscapter pachys]|uniref:CRAL-TRIO domain-containing protein n=1 Tax=Diploscapter pachys TaxID=2018661 RepID=A0A2A2JDC8_9BILA|nr:hypothetical protein WR25_21248 [Diploscapter pachys]
MDITRHSTKVLKHVASLPGSRDRHGSPLIFIYPPNSAIMTKSASTSDLASSLPYEDLVSVLGYFITVPSPEDLKKGFVLVVDARNAQPKTLKAILRAAQQALYRRIRRALIVQPDKFLNQQKINFDIILEGYEFKSILISVHKLSKYIDISQLPEELGGTFSYNAEKWVEKREKVSHALNALQRKSQELVRQGKSAAPLDEQDECIERAMCVMAELEEDAANPDTQHACKTVEKAIIDLKTTASAPEREEKEKKEKEETVEKAKMFEKHAAGVNRLLDWIEGPGERWMQTLHEIGESADEAKQLSKEHVQLLAKSDEIVQQADELAELATRLMAAIPEHSITLEKARGEVRAIAADFKQRAEKQAETVALSEKFHITLGKLSRRTDLLLEYLCTDKKLIDLDEAEKEKKELEAKVTEMDKMYETMVEEGSTLLGELTERGAMWRGKPTRDYAHAIGHVQGQMAAARERRARCIELVNVRRLKLHQFVQLFTCESDATQAIKWIDELYETVIKDYNEIVCDENELRILREDKKKLEETSLSTYEYGKQLCETSRVLRRALRTGSDLDATRLRDKLEQSWTRLQRALRDNEERLNVTEAFNATIHEINIRISEVERKLVDVIADRKSNPHRALATERRQLREDIEELARIADMLAAQINANHNSTAEVRQAMIQAIKRKVEGIEEKARRMESLMKELPPIQEQESSVKTASVSGGNNGILTDNYSALTAQTTPVSTSIRLSDTESYL